MQKDTELKIEGLSLEKEPESTPPSGSGITKVADDGKNPRDQGRNCLKSRRFGQGRSRPTPYVAARHSALLEARFLEAVTHNNSDVVAEMLRKGMSANTVESYYRRSALHIACSRGYTDTVRVLLQNGANPNIRDMNNNTPLHLAACTDNIEMVQLLLDYGTDLLLRDSNGLLALDIAIGKLRISERIVSKLQNLSQSDIHRHRDKTVIVCDRMFGCLKQQMIRRNPADWQGWSKEKLLERFNEFSQVLVRIRDRQIAAIVNKIDNMKVKSEIDNDVNSLLSTLQQISI
ncbi:potassium channel AKT1-like [Anopheles albimanus]|uniref:potassium channel AKT1-like n=1 Tax=Anopheles albimanus TaxID=7167 RepID=UPI00163FB442|nr:potassium channel AKT1-like [Anopheles albimanus]